MSWMLGAAAQQGPIHRLLVGECRVPARAETAATTRRRKSGKATRSSGPRPRTRSRIRAAAARPAASGTGWLASTTSMRVERADAVAVTGDDETAERPVRGPVGFDCAGHRGGGLAGADDDRASGWRLGQMGGTQRRARRLSPPHRTLPQQRALIHGVSLPLAAARRRRASIRRRPPGRSRGRPGAPEPAPWPNGPRPPRPRRPLR